MLKINFKYFGESNQEYEMDIQSVMDGIKFIQKINKKLKQEGIIAEQVTLGTITSSFSSFEEPGEAPCILYLCY